MYDKTNMPKIKIEYKPTWWSRQCNHISDMQLFSTRINLIYQKVRISAKDIFIKSLHTVHNNITCIKKNIRIFKEILWNIFEI